ncbi:MAG: sugar transferase [Clostridia bacterium]|nr:sugar transferase [Clostridia bacterium]
MYAKCLKRVLDFLLSLIALAVLSPILLILTVVGAIAMKGNPFFTQLRPGKIDKRTGKEKIFRLIKFRTMSNAKDRDGNLQPDEVRLNRYGKFLRSTSLDELLEILNILKFYMAIVGPRPLVVKYLPYFTESERVRHSVRPGLTGFAQVNGRNSLKWEEKFAYDLEYVQNITFRNDVMIIMKTIRSVLVRENIGVRGMETLVDFDTYRKQQMENENVH